MTLRLITSTPLVLAFVATMALALAGPVSADRLDGANTGGRPISVTMTGAAERPGPGDPDGSGVAHFTLNYGQNEICYRLEVSDIATATAAHIHLAPSDAPGPVVVPLVAPSDGSSSGCVSVDRELIKAILLHPENYYVNVHNAEFPAGAIRGQLG